MKSFKMETNPDGRQKVIVTEGAVWIAYRDIGGTLLTKKIETDWEEGIGETLVGIFESEEEAEKAE